MSVLTSLSVLMMEVQWVVISALCDVCSLGIPFWFGHTLAYSNQKMVDDADFGSFVVHHTPVLASPFFTRGNTINLWFCGPKRCR